MHHAPRSWGSMDRGHHEHLGRTQWHSMDWRTMAQYQEAGWEGLRALLASQVPTLEQGRETWVSLRGCRDRYAQLHRQALLIPVLETRQPCRNQLHAGTHTAVSGVAGKIMAATACTLGQAYQSIKLPNQYRLGLTLVEVMTQLWSRPSLNGND